MTVLQINRLINLLAFSPNKPENSLLRYCQNEETSPQTPSDTNPNATSPSQSTRSPTPHPFIPSNPPTSNNSSLIGRILSTRKQWQEMNDQKYLFLNFRWQQTNKSYKYQNCIDNKIFRHCLNHFQYHQELSNKEMLFRNLSEYCETQKIDVFDIVPLTFVLNFSDGQCQQNMNTFLNVFDKCMPEKMKLEHRKNTLFVKKKRSSVQKNYDLRQKDTSKLTIKDTFIEKDDSSYLWILKPTFQNRGNGIHVFNSLQSLENLINSYISGDVHSSKNLTQQSSSPEIRSKSFRIRQYCNPQRPTVTSFVVQKYMQKPLLIDGRKFDIRMWVLISHEMKVYLFKQGYIRTSSFKYSTSEGCLGDNNIHLTNNAVQKNNSDYGKFEDGNQLSFKVLKNLIESEGGSYAEVISRIKWIVKTTALSVKKKLNKNQRSHCFQIFGYDFMLDVNCKPWLIEVNTNPCIEESSRLLQSLLPRMLDDAFCLTLDRIFETEKKGYNYSIENEYSTDNLWQLIVDLRKSQSVAVSQQLISQTKRVID